jgi:hypothetical protein
LQRPTPEFCHHEPRDSIGATASVTLEITLRHLAIELFLGSAILIAARHIEQLANGRILCVGPFAIDAERPGVTRSITSRDISR